MILPLVRLVAFRALSLTLAEIRWASPNRLSTSLPLQPHAMHRLTQAQTLLVGRDDSDAPRAKPLYVYVMLQGACGASLAQAARRESVRPLGRGAHPQHRLFLRMGRAT